MEHLIYSCVVTVSPVLLIFLLAYWHQRRHRKPRRQAARTAAQAAAFTAALVLIEAFGR